MKRPAEQMDPNRGSQSSHVRPAPWADFGPRVGPAAGNGALPRPARSDAVLRVGFVVGSFTFGGSETETIELIYGADRQRFAFSGIAVKLPLPLPEGEPPKDGSFPPIYTAGGKNIDPADPRVRIVASFKEAVLKVVRESDIVLTWGVHTLQDYLPDGPLPRFVIVSKDSGEWARSFLAPNSLLTRNCVGNSTLAAQAFPRRVHRHAKVIYDGINPRRVACAVDRDQQRRSWGLETGDKIVGYLGRIEADKGVSKTVEGVAKLPAVWKAVFIGANPNCRYVEQLREHCETMIPGRYRILGWCHDVGSALAAMDVFCQPSEHEGFSNSLGEAWLAGVPTVYTRGTGALPDLGELGIGVSPHAGGDEMASAILRASGNDEMVRHARALIEGNYLVAHNVRRWMEYLDEVHRRPSKVRTFVVVPAALLSRAAPWLAATCDTCIGIEFCAVLALDENGFGPHPALARLERWHGCPAWAVQSRADVELAVRYTRPDLILGWGLPSLAHVLPRNNQIQVLDAASLDRFDPYAAQPIEAGWTRKLASIAKYVHSED